MDSVAIRSIKTGGEAAQANNAVMRQKEKSWRAEASLSPPTTFLLPAERPVQMKCGEVSAPASYLKSVDCSYDAQEPWHQWSIAFSAERMLTAIQAKYAGVQEIHDIDASKTSDSGAV